MQPELLVFQGHSCETLPMREEWKGYLATLAYQALPVLALQVQPYPLFSLRVERKCSGEERAFLAVLRELLAEGSAPTLDWQTFFATDGSIQESYLLLTFPDDAYQQVRLRFLHTQHYKLLKAFAQAGQVALVGSAEETPIYLPSAPSSLNYQLNALHTQRKAAVVHA